MLKKNKCCSHVLQHSAVHSQSCQQQQASLLFQCSLLNGSKLVPRWRLKALLLHFGFIMRDHSDQNVRCHGAQFQTCPPNSSVGNQKYMPWHLLFSIFVCLWDGGWMTDWEKLRSRCNRQAFNSKMQPTYKPYTFFLREMQLYYILFTFFRAISGLYHMVV